MTLESETRWHDYEVMLADLAQERLAKRGSCRKCIYSQECDGEWTCIRGEYCKPQYPSHEVEPTDSPLDWGCDGWYAE